MSRRRAQAYVICTSPRSGSTLLCRLLAATGTAGQPDSHFHTPTRAAWRKTYGLSDAVFASDQDQLGAIFAAARARGTGETGVFGLRLQRGSFEFFMAQLALLCPQHGSDAARIKAVFGQTLFIHLTRTDKLGQAISCVKARQTGLWHQASDGTEVERTGPPQDPRFDRSAIATELGEFTAFDAAWTTWFSDQKLQPLRITYEDLSRDPAAQLARVLAALGQDPAAAQASAPPLRKLAGATNRDWAARFRADDEGSQSRK
mgnify:CR=1 FL=1